MSLTSVEHYKTRQIDDKTDPCEGLLIYFTK